MSKYYYYKPKGLPKKKCKICEQDFQCTGKNQSYCLKPDCQLKRHSQSEMRRYQRKQIINYKNCLTCNKTFPLIKWRKKYCSNVCLFKMMRKNKKTKYKQIYIAKPKIEGICGFCEKIFIKNFSHQKFCSRKCIRKPHAQRRFRILKRDKFTCQYCGRKAPFVTLHVDHIIPSSKGGTSEDQNLTTACQDCNLGKSDIFNE